MCLRCTEVELAPAEPFVPKIEFFDCPACHRQYARKPGQSLTFRWLHPISIALYSILFDSEPLLGLAQSPKLSEPERRRMIEEIELELTQPTQQVRDILDNPQTEEECRQFLGEFVARLRKPGDE